MTRAEHLQRAKDRALELLDKYHDHDQAFASMMSDLTKHPELSTHIGIELGMLLRVAGQLGTSEQLRHWITGFN